jgi:ubiquinone/menaquinone biosynthesis C-methylase UbiE
VTTRPDNPFAALDVGEVYKRGRPYHHPSSLERVRAVIGAEAEVGRALDVACGTGMSTTALAEFTDTVVGLDISPEMMRVAPPSPNVTFMLGSAEQLPFVDASFDAVTCSSGIHWFDQQRFFEELQRVVRVDGWIGLYDHYFIGMRDEEGFGAWARALFDRYPLPPRNPQVGDPRSETPKGFDLVGTEMFEDPIEMTRREFADYQLTVSNCVAAAERGAPRTEILEWLLESTASLFGDDDDATRVVLFVGSNTCLRRLP